MTTPSGTTSPHIDSLAMQASDEHRRTEEVGILCSTIIPTINRPTLTRAVESALEQNIAPGRHELIVVNNSGDLLPQEHWQTSPNVTIVNTNRTKISFTHNVGAAVAKGKFLHFLHDDDYLLPGGLKALLDAAQTSDSLWIYGALNRIDDDGAFMSVNRLELRGNIFAYLVAGENIHMGPSLIDREAFFRVGGFNPGLSIIIDLELEGQLALIGSFKQIDDVIANIRVGLAGSTTDWSRIREEYRFFREKMLNAPGALVRMQDSANGNVFLRGRACRAYAVSGLLNLRAGQLCTGARRLAGCLRLAGGNIFAPQFWRGMTYSWQRAPGT